MEMVTEPSILFLDEPSSGLDAFNAYKVVMEERKGMVVRGKHVARMMCHTPLCSALAWAFRVTWGVQIRATRPI